MINLKNPLIKGTFILVIIGLINKILGFILRIFLSKCLGAEKLGIYQLIFPVQGICFALCSAGIQTAISQITAKFSGNKNDIKQKDALRGGIILSMIISILCSVMLYSFSNIFSLYILNEKRCDILIKILAVSLPFSSIHSCITGYYYGKENAKIPAVSILLEQIIRVSTTIFLWIYLTKTNKTFEAWHAVAGILSGEVTSSLYCYISIKKQNFNFTKCSLNTFKLITKTSFPLTCNKVVPGIFQGGEAILLPLQLTISGMSMSESLKIYGIITGIALPFIMFPATITNSMSLLLLPTIAKADAEKKGYVIFKTSVISLLMSIGLGIFFTLFFFVEGHNIGNMIFKNNSSGIYLTKMSLVCPFLYANTTMTSILNGLGHVNKTFIYNLISITIRILMLLLVVPYYGIIAYIGSILASQAILFILHLFSLISIICTFLPASQSALHHQNS